MYEFLIKLVFIAYVVLLIYLLSELLSDDKNKKR